jgi:hypothetical protein
MAVLFALEPVEDIQILQQQTKGKISVFGIDRRDILCNENVTVHFRNFH